MKTSSVISELRWCLCGGSVFFLDTCIHTEYCQFLPKQAKQSEVWGCNFLLWISVTADRNWSLNDIFFTLSAEIVQPQT